MDKNSLPPVRFANKIRQLRQQKLYQNKLFLIVEGATDKRLFSGFIIAEKCEIIDAMGKENAEEILKILNKSNFAGVIAVVDSDFRHLENIAPHHNNLFFTDTHDMETMILKSPAFEKLLREFVSEGKISLYGNNYATEIRKILLESALPLSCLLWVSLKEKLNLKFEGINFGKFIGKENLKNDLEKMIKEVKNNSQQHHISNDEIEEKIRNIINKNYDPWLVCCGHHLICVLSIGFQKLWATRNSKEVEPEILERELRLAYEYTHFRETGLFNSIRQWENRNRAWSILGG